MMTLSRWKIILVVLAAIFGVIFTLPNLLPPDARDSLPGFLPRKALNLGLDLQGGIHLAMGVDVDRAVKAKVAELGGSIPPKSERPPAKFGRFVNAEIARWSPILNAASAGTGTH